MSPSVHDDMEYSEVVFFLIALMWIAGFAVGCWIGGVL